MSELSKNVRYLRDYLGMSQADFGQLFDCNRDNIMSYERGTEPKLKTLQLIANYFHTTIDTLYNTELNSHCTISRDDKGNVYLKCIPNSIPNSKSEELGIQKSIEPDEANLSVDIVDVRAAANVQGLSIHDGPIENLGVLPVPKHLLSRINRKHFWFPIIGDSMEPTIYIDDYVLAALVEPQDYSTIRDNYIYIISTANHGILIKRVLNRLEERGQLYARSDNRSYSSFNIDHREIVSIWEARAKLSFKFPNEPLNMYNAVRDLEARVESLERKK